MIAARAQLALSFALLALVACDERVDPLRSSAPRPAMADDSRHTVVVNQNANGNGVAATVQEGIDMVMDGGVVKVWPGTYNERILIDKGLTLEAIGSGLGAVIISQSQTTAAPATEAVILIQTANPVVLRDFTVHHDNIRGVNVLRDADLLVERMTFEGVSTASTVVGNGVTAHYNAGTSGKRARVVVRDSRFAVGGIGISFGGDVEGLVERNEIRQSVGRLPCVVVTPVGQGGTMLSSPGTRTDVDVIDNLFEDCGTNLFGRFNMVAINGTVGASTTGTINIVGNTFRHTTPTGCAASGILYAFYTGVIEHNRLIGVTQPAPRQSPRRTIGEPSTSATRRSACDPRASRCASTTLSTTNGRRCASVPISPRRSTPRATGGAAPAAPRASGARKRATASWSNLALPPQRSRRSRSRRSPAYQRRISNANESDRATKGGKRRPYLTNKPPKRGT